MGDTAGVLTGVTGPTVGPQARGSSPPVWTGPVTARCEEPSAAQVAGFAPSSGPARVWGLQQQGHPWGRTPAGRQDLALGPVLLGVARVPLSPLVLSVPH